jgi:hypothetical protein
MAVAVRLAVWVGDEVHDCDADGVWLPESVGVRLWL